jgi:mannose-6-phosphate isomerase-like protein (cupin superfamily)
MSNSTGRAILTTGRPLDADGVPTDGPALTLDSEGEAAALLEDSPRALVASPGGGLWATLLAPPGEAAPESLTVEGNERPPGDADEDRAERPTLLQWLAPDASAPPAHVHPTTETFRVVEGELTVVLDGKARQVRPGEAVTVPAGVEHAFRNDTDEQVAFVAWLPSMRTARTLYSVWGMDVEGTFGSGPPGHEDRYGEPGPLRGLLLAETLRGETTMSGPPLAVQRLLWATVGRVASAAGYRTTDDRYLDDAFWERHVEQPDL